MSVNVNLHIQLEDSADLARLRQIIGGAKTISGTDGAAPTTTQAPRFVKLDVAGDDLPDSASDWAAVRDNQFGLIWSAGSVATERLSHAAAEAACKESSLCGDQDWRLPTISELLTLVDYTKHDPAIDQQFFRCEPAAYWTASPWAPSPASYAWIVAFYGGNSDSFHRGYAFVRAVRSVPGQ